MATPRSPTPVSPKRSPKRSPTPQPLSPTPMPTPRSPTTMPMPRSTPTPPMPRPPSSTMPTVLLRSTAPALAAATLAAAALAAAAAAAATAAASASATAAAAVAAAALRRLPRGEGTGERSLLSESSEGLSSSSLSSSVFLFLVAPASRLILAATALTTCTYKPSDSRCGASSAASSFARFASDSLPVSRPMRAMARMRSSPSSRSDSLSIFPRANDAGQFCLLYSSAS
mmetsp:Transcript_25975/g.82309  ORF Transcript_25975/g.82309 Transcript_25975/m.82309 type:complete len:229 (-) Transcript_25975:1080-1766(-)